MTNKSYGNYELILDVWPSFGDDGGVFNRTTANGTCYQTTMDYIQGSSVGGVYFEGGYTGATRNVDPFVFGANKYTIHFPKGQLPPTRGFWSITMYDANYFFVANPINRYSISTRQNLKANADGSIDFTLRASTFASSFGSNMSVFT